MFQLKHIIDHMGPFAMAIALSLLVMAVASLAVFFERLYALAKSRRQSRQFAAEARQLLTGGDIEGVIEKANDFSGSHLAALLASGAKVFVAQKKSFGGKLAPLEAARRELNRQSEAIAARIRRGFGVLASVGSVAPFVGLLGTVVGIIDAFQGIAKEGSGGLGAVSAGISEALVVTALGLLVAIPAVLAFNWLTSQSESMLLALEQARGEFLDHLENREGKAHVDVRHAA